MGVWVNKPFMWLLPQMVARKQLFLSSWSGRQTGRPPRYRAESPLHVAPLWVAVGISNGSTRETPQSTTRSWYAAVDSR